MLITDVFLSEDGHAQERSLLAQVLQRVEVDQLWIEDRNFCPLGLMFGMDRRSAAFVVESMEMLGIIGKLRENGLHHARTAQTRRSPAMRVKPDMEGEGMPDAA
jgi:hypothetical protein